MEDIVIVEEENPANFGEIIEEIDCPQCGYLAHLQRFHVTGEERLTCDFCGYGHLKLLDSEEENKGYGAIHYAYKSGINKYICLRYPLSSTEIENVKNQIDKECDRWKSSFYIYDDKEGVQTIIGPRPMTVCQKYDELAEQQYFAMQKFCGYGFNDF